jgi:hypothetical protein
LSLIVADILIRLPPTTRHGLRLPPSACGSMPVPGQRLTRPTALRTSSSTLPSRFDPIGLKPHGKRLTTIFRAPTSARSTNWSWRLRTWVLT